MVTYVQSILMDGIFFNQTTKNVSGLSRANAETKFLIEDKYRYCHLLPDNKEVRESIAQDV